MMYFASRLPRDLCFGTSMSRNYTDKETRNAHHAAPIERERDVTGLRIAMTQPYLRLYLQFDTAYDLEFDVF